MRQRSTRFSDGREMLLRRAGRKILRTNEGAGDADESGAGNILGVSGRFQWRKGTVLRKHYC